MKFIASAQDPQKQLVMFDQLGQGPANPATDALIPDDKKRSTAPSAEALAKQVALDAEWYAENYSAALEKFLALVSKYTNESSQSEGAAAPLPADRKRQESLDHVPILDAFAVLLAPLLLFLVARLCAAVPRWWRSGASPPGAGLRPVYPHLHRPDRAVGASSARCASA